MAPCSLVDLTFDELTELLKSPSRARAALRWLWHEPLPVELPTRIESVSQQAWKSVLKACELRLPKIIQKVVSQDQTIKYSLDASGAALESVLIPGPGRSTLCISSQSGCSRACAFCATGKLGLKRNLTTGEIVAQLLLAQNDVRSGAPLRNIVFMGMGEPMDNLDAVIRAVRIFMQAPAPQLAAGHITVSTSGILEGMRRFLDECPANLALSLNGSTDEQREKIMAQNCQASIGDLISLLRDHSRHGKRIFFIEYVMLDGFNDSLKDAERLLQILKGVRARVNLIAHNVWEYGNGAKSPWRPSPMERIRAFQDKIHHGGVRCLFRCSKGPEINAACGQLVLKQEQKQK